MAQISNSSERTTSLFDGKYEILATIGRGRNSVVYKARVLEEFLRPGIPEIVALKVFTGNSRHPEANVDRLNHEALAMLSCRDTQVIKLYDYVHSGDICYLAIEFAQYGDLGSALEGRVGPVRFENAIFFLSQILTALKAIHRSGIVHCDIKPENLLLTDHATLKISDFSVALLPTQELTPEEIMRAVGTLDYLAPECLSGRQHSAATDLYSVGVTGYQLITRHLPFAGETLSEQIDNKMRGVITPVSEHAPDVPELIEKLLAKALQSDPAKRFHSAEEFAAAIEAVMSGSWEADSVNTADSRNTEVPQTAAYEPSAAEVPLPAAKTVSIGLPMSAGERIEVEPFFVNDTVEQTVGQAVENTVEQTIEHSTELPLDADSTEVVNENSAEIFYSRDEQYADEIADESTNESANDNSNEIPNDISNENIDQIDSSWGESEQSEETDILLTNEDLSQQPRKRGFLKKMSFGLFQRPTDRTIFNQASKFLMVFISSIIIAFGGHDLIAVAMQGPTVKPSPIFRINTGTHAGVLMDFWGDRLDLPFVTHELPDEKLLFTLSSPGFTPQVVDTSRLNRNRPLVVSGNGLTVSISFNKVNEVPNAKLSGSYTIHGSGNSRELRWAVYEN